MAEMTAAEAAELGMTLNFSTGRAALTKLDERPFDGKKALVVGGTGGIGRFVSLDLARAGAEITVIGRTKKKLDETINEINKIEGRPANARGVLLDLKPENAIEDVLSVCEQTDILITAFGPFLRKPLAQTSAADWRRLVTLNLIFPGALVSGYLDGMMKRRWGRILLFGGTNTAQIRGWTTTAPYAAAKTALGALAKSVAKNAASFGVCCNVICPGLTDTEYMDETALLYNRENSPDGCALRPEEIAAFAIEILRNPNLNGAILPIDKGVEVHVV
ncbi:MAG: SDR family NAD(P)-dependent oxidoreductase [Spirochaetaceae bacterium]|nr:SDR family NAD(P)-dependent oxidoreductase [Spirochaetaceae bacterium]